MNQYGVIFDKEKMARAHGIFPVSTKQSIEISLRIKGKKLEKAKNLLQDVLDEKRPIKYTRSNAPHKRGIGPGKYPLKAVGYFAKLLDLAEANAHFQGLSTDDLTVKTIVVNRVSRPMRYGRNPGRVSKRTGVWLVLEQAAAKKKETSAKDVKSDKQAPIDTTEKITEKQSEVKETAPVEEKITIKPKAEQTAKPADKATEESKTQEVKQ